MICAACQTENDETNAFCTRCGAVLSENSPAPAEQPVSPYMLEESPMPPESPRGGRTFPTRLAAILGSAAVVLAIGVFAVTRFFLCDLSLLIHGEAGYAKFIEADLFKRAAASYTASPAVLQAQLTQMPGVLAQNPFDYMYTNLQALAVQPGYEATVSGSLTLGDSLRALAADDPSFGPLEALAGYLGKLSLDVRSASDGEGFSSSVKVSDPTADLFDGTFFYNGSSVALQMPGVSEQYLLYDLGTEPPPPVDPAEVSRIAGMLADLYLSYYDKAQVDVQSNQDASLGDVAISGKRIAVTFDHALLTEMLDEMLTALENDAYVQTTVTDYQRVSLGDAYTEAQYHEDFARLRDSLTETGDTSLAVVTYMSGANIFLGREYTVTSDGTESTLRVYIQGDDLAASAAAGGVEYVSLTRHMESESDGEMTILGKNLEGDGGTMGLTIRINGVSTGEWMGSTVPVGTFTFTIPEEDTVWRDAGGSDEAYNALQNGSLTVIYTLDGDTLNTDASLSVEGYVEAGFTVSCRANNDVPAPIPDGVYTIRLADVASDPEVTADMSDYLGGLRDYYLGVYDGSADFRALMDALGIGRDGVAAPFDGLIGVLAFTGTSL